MFQETLEPIVRSDESGHLINLENLARRGIDHKTHETTFCFLRYNSIQFIHVYTVEYSNCQVQKITTYMLCVHQFSHQVLFTRGLLIEDYRPSAI